MNVFLNYSNRKFAMQRRFGAFCAKQFGKFDRIISLDPGCIDGEFAARNRHILSAKRGGGYWLWKPYVILQQLRLLEAGDLLVYCDAGSFFTGPVPRILAAMEPIKQDICSFELPYSEKQFTNRATLDALAPGNLAIAESNQVMGGFHFIRKSSFTLHYYETFLRHACDENLITDRGTRPGQEDQVFLEHRHDQSIHSVLYKLNGLKPVGDATQWGGPIAHHLARLPATLEPGTPFTKTNGQIHRDNPATAKMPEVLFNNRRQNPILAYGWYRAKRALLAPR